MIHILAIIRALVLVIGIANHDDIATVIRIYNFTRQCATNRILKQKKEVDCLICAGTIINLLRQLQEKGIRCETIKWCL